MRIKTWVGVVAHYNPSTWEAEAAGLMSKPCGPCIESLPLKRKRKKLKQNLGREAVH